ncbi:MAG: hypothetical protein JPMHGGIA_02344 [Saprospiraceae bacterium]|nr:hypothetical protein [Saprospiraceae bacterium]
MECFYKLHTDMVLIPILYQFLETTYSLYVVVRK